MRVSTSSLLIWESPVLAVIGPATGGSFAPERATRGARPQHGAQRGHNGGRMRLSDHLHEKDFKKQRADWKKGFCLSRYCRVED